MLDKMIKSILKKFIVIKVHKENEEKKLGLELFNKYVKKMMIKLFIHNFLIHYYYNYLL